MWIEHIGNAARHAGGEIAASFADNHDLATGHVFTAVITDAFYHCARAAVSHTKTLTTHAPKIRLTRSRAVQRDIADQNIFFRHKGRGARRKDDEFAAGQALADIIVGVTFQTQRDTTRNKCRETLAGRAIEIDFDGVVRQTLTAMALREFISQEGADSAINIANRQRQLNRPITNLLTNLQSNTTYTFEMCYQIFVDSNGDGIVDESKLKDNGGLCYTSTFTTGSINIALPVELLNFQAQTQGKNALLTWQTTSEKDNTGFKIERSVDAQKFENIGFVVGNGTTSEKQSYSFTDETPLSMGGYYRLCQVDNNGNKAYSKTVYVANAQKGVLTLSPNPAYDRISLGLSDDVVDATVTVFDMMGRVLLQTKFAGFNAHQQPRRAFRHRAV